MHMVGYFEGVDSERGIAWRRADSLSLPDNGETYRTMLMRMAKENGIETPSAEDLARLERKRKRKKLSNEDWTSPTGLDAKIARM